VCLMQGVAEPRFILAQVMRVKAVESIDCEPSDVDAVALLALDVLSRFGTWQQLLLLFSLATRASFAAAAAPSVLLL